MQGKEWDKNGIVVKHLDTINTFVIVGDCGKIGRGNGAMECPNIGVYGGTYDAVKLEKGKKILAVRSYADDTREDVQTPLGQNRLIIT